MKLLILSDLHLEHGGFEVPGALEYDAVILAGDIHNPGHRAVHWARRSSVFGTNKPIVLVPGNHEFYERELSAELAEMRRAAHGTNVHVLSCDSLVLDGPAGGQVRILGATLWTDFGLPVQEDGRDLIDMERALAVANRRLNDFRLISVSTGPVPKFNRGRRTLTAEDTVAMHWIDRAWLQHQLSLPFSGETVVVTHHAPSRESVHAKYVSDWLSPAFVSHLPDDMFGSVSLWIHGHTHTSSDYMRDGCRVVCNPRGYRYRDGSFENDAFRPACVVDVPTR